MTPDRWQRVEKLFSDAIELPESERAAFLSRECGADDDLRREVDSLIACDVPGEQLIEIPVPATVGEPREMEGRRIGPYLLKSLIGHGGMGSVYLGVRDDDQYQKQVAIKLLKRGMDTDFMLDRFRLERQILANLEHPFIARLIDGGATNEGLPYFVMEYVDGTPITAYCQRNALPVAERLRLFRLVCEAVQHAHQNLVVHRDIKPSNILTTADGVPKLVDFGIAKVLNPGVSFDITITQREYRMLTPDYASPEQVQGLPISTAADIYSLGAVLYELLSGQKPHRFASQSMDDLERAICEMQPVKPSVAAASNMDLPAATRNQLRRQLSGDLDNIVLTALRKEPQRRYASAAEFADDIRRHLELLPVRARDDRWTYRAWKFARRHRTAVLAASLVIASLVGGIVTTSIQARRAERRFQVARGLAGTMLFELHDQMERLPGSTSLRSTTVRAVVKYLDALSADGATDPGLNLDMAFAYNRAGSLEGHPFMANLGRSGAAIDHYRKAIAIFERLLDDGAYRVRAINGLIDTHLKASQLESQSGNPLAAARHLERAESYGHEALETGGGEIEPGTLVSLYFRLADRAYEHGSADGEIEQYAKALGVVRRWAAADPNADSLGNLSDVLRNMASAHARNGSLAAARQSYLEALQTTVDLARRTKEAQAFQYRRIDALMALGDLAAAPDDPNFGDHAKAVEYYSTANSLASRFAATDLDNANARRMEAATLWRLGMIWAVEKPEAALEYHSRSVAISESLLTLAPQNAEYRYHASRAYMGMGEALTNLNRAAEGVRHLRTAIDLQRAIDAVSPERIWNLRVLSRAYMLLGVAHAAAGSDGDAAAAFSDALGTADGMLRRAPSSLPHQLDRADVLEAMGRHYLRQAARAGAASAERMRLRKEAHGCFERSLATWHAWSARGVAAPYTAARLSAAAKLVATAGLIR